MNRKNCYIFAFTVLFVIFGLVGCNETSNITCDDLPQSFAEQETSNMTEPNDDSVASSAGYEKSDEIAEPISPDNNSNGEDENVNNVIEPDGTMDMEIPSVAGDTRDEISASPSDIIETETPADNEQGQEATEPSIEETEERLENTESSMVKQSYAGLNYWLYTPSNPKENMPLIVYLHGGSGKGDDLELITDVDGFPKYVKDGTLSADAYIIFPQCPSKQKGWNTLSKKINELIDHACEDFSIDTSKISLTGHSMGGTGTWNLALSNPERFYKIAPMSGSVSVSDENIEKLSSLSIWAFVGSNDKIVSPDTSINMIDALKESGADAQITIFEDATHFDVPALGYLDMTVNIIDWLVR